MNLSSTNAKQMPPAPSAPPRELTDLVRRRSLQEPRVRFWWLTALVLLAVAIGFLVHDLSRRQEELHIVNSGVPISATVIAVGEGEVEGRANLSPEYPATLQYFYDGQEYDEKGFLEGRTDPISLKQTVPIKIDPASPKNWTYLTTTPPIGPAFLSALLVAPFALGPLLISYLLRRRLLRTWQTGMANPFAVEAISQTALAPSSRAVRCRPLEGSSRQILTVFIARRTADPKPGDLLWLIHPPGKSSPVLAAVAYE
jgi:hypothetical protein